MASFIFLGRRQKYRTFLLDVNKSNLFIHLIAIIGIPDMRNTVKKKSRPLP